MIFSGASLSPLLDFWVVLPLSLQEVGWGGGDLICPCTPPLGFSPFVPLGLHSVCTPDVCLSSRKSSLALLSELALSQDLTRAGRGEEAMRVAWPLFVVGQHLLYNTVFCMCTCKCVYFYERQDRQRQAPASSLFCWLCSLWRDGYV